MGENTKIEWTDHSWNPWQGCHKVSLACDNCYMYRDKKRYGKDPSIIHRSSIQTFNQPLKLGYGKVFACSWSDFFIKEADEWRDDAWDIIRKTGYLTYQILTKRPENIKNRLPKDWGNGWPNVWLGVTAENQEMADLRIPILLSIPAAVRFVSVEPMLGPLDLDSYLIVGADQPDSIMRKGLDWVICGGESGPNARPMHPDWVRSLREQCQAAGVPFFFKQWGEFVRCDYQGKDFGASYIDSQCIDGELWDLDNCDDNGNLYSTGDNPTCPKCKGMGFLRIGKKAAGDLLDGERYHEIPRVS